MLDNDRLSLCYEFKPNCQCTCFQPVFKVYHGHDSSGGFMSTIPLVSENVLIHDAEGTTYDNGCSIVMQRLVVCQHVIHLFKIKKKSLNA